MMLDGIESLYIPLTFARFRSHGESKSNRDMIEFGFELLGILKRLFQETEDGVLKHAKLKGYNQAFRMITSGYDHYTDVAQDRKEEALKALVLWVQHLQACEREYSEASEMLVESFYRIGQSYCLCGHMKEGRRYFARAFKTDKMAYKSILGSIISLMGASPYKGFTKAWRKVFSSRQRKRLTYRSDEELNVEGFYSYI